MSSKGYEILYILNTNHTQEQRQAISERIQGFITKKGGNVLEHTEIGLKDFAIELKKQTQGYYYQCHFMATADQLEHLQSELKVTEDVFRFLIVTLDSVLGKEALNAKVPS